MLDTDNAVVTTLTQTSRATGTAPFDDDNNPGNDRDADNDIVRSFDTVAYTYSFALNTRDESTYYRKGRVGFQFRLNQPADKVTFDLDSMGWGDTTPSYKPKLTTETIDGQPIQVLTVYRLLSGTQNQPTVIPGSSGITLVLQVRNMANGSSFTPQVQAWGAPDATTMNDPASVASDLVIVSAKLNLNLRIDGGVNEGSGNRIFDFDTPAARNYPNHELGKRKGVISKFNWAVDMRWPDRSKGLKGLEAPSGPVTFSLSLSNLWQETESGQAHPKLAELQPYFWDIGTIDGDFSNEGRRTADQGWSPRFDNYDYARSTGGRTGVDRVQGNGRYTMAEHRTSQGLRLDLTLNDYQVTDSFPKLGHIYAPGTECTPTLASTDCGRVEVAEISTGYLYVFNPSTVKGRDVADHYGQSGISLQSKVNDGGLGAISVSGQQLPETSGPEDTANQTVDSDDQWHNVMYTHGSATAAGSSNIIQYSCLTQANYFDDGVDCGWWNAPDNKQGTDSAVAGTQVRVMAGYSFQADKADLPPLGLTLVKIDPDVVRLPEPGKLDLPWTGNSIWQDAAGYDIGNDNQWLTLVKYATKPDGSTWENDEEQANADMEDLRFYDTPEQAGRNGTIVGMLLGARTAAPEKYAGKKDSRYGFDGFLIDVLPEAKVGSVAQLTSVSRTFSRSQLASKAGLSPENSSDQQWEE